MKFLKNLNEEPEKDEEKEEEKQVTLKVTEKYNIIIRCNNMDCDYWGKMEGGPLQQDPEKAAYLCPRCEHISYMKWRGLG